MVYEHQSPFKRENHCFTIYAFENANKQLLSGADALFAAKESHSSPFDLPFAGLEAITFPSLIFIFAFFLMRRRSFRTQSISKQPARNARTFVPLWKVFNCVGAEIVWSSCTTFNHRILLNFEVIKFRIQDNPAHHQHLPSS